MDQDQELNSNVQVFIVDKDLRKIILPDTTTILGVAGDICVNQVVFNIPRIVNGYDLSEFTPYIDYTNANGEGNYSSGVNIVNANDTVSFVWELEPDVTTYSGNVLFAVRLLKVNSSEIVKRFKTQPAKAQVMSGLNVTSQVTQEAQYDILARIEIDATNNIKQRLRVITDQHIDELNTCAENKLSDIESYVDNMSSEFNQNIIDKKKEITDLTEISKKEIEKTKINAVNDLSWKTPVDKNTAAIASLKEDLENVFSMIGNKYVVTQSKTSDHDIVLHKGNYVFSQTELGVETTVVLYNTDTYESGNPDNLKVWDDIRPSSTVPLVVNVSLPKDYKHIHIWQSPTNTNVVLNIEQIGSVTDYITKIDNVFGKEILQLNAGTKSTSFNDINGLTKDKAFVFVMNARPNNLVIRLDTNEVYNTNSQNLLTVANGVYADEDVYISDVVIFDKDYRSARTYNNGTNVRDKVFVYEINYVEKENRKRINAIDDVLMRGLEEVAFEWDQHLFYENGDTSSTNHTDAISTPKLYGNGLYIITFPDELVATYNAVNHEGKRRNLTSYHPFSYFCNDFVRVYFKRKDSGELLPTSEIVNKIKIMRLNRKMSEYDVTVCASDSNPYKKEKADIVLNGDNDTEILSALFGCYNSITVFLFNGTYNINKMYTYSDTAKIALPFNSMNYDGGSGYRRYITVIGESYSTPQTLDSVKFAVSEELHSSCADGGINYFIIGTPYSKDDSPIGRMATSCVLKNFNIIGYKYNKPITYVDTTRCLSTMIDSVNIRSWYKGIETYNAFDETPHRDCCGIRVGRGSNYGIQNSVKHSNVWYCGIGVACNGEHFIFEDVKTHHDLIGFVFGDRYTVGHQEHPNILIGCSIEGCYRLMLLTKDGITDEQDYTSKFYKSTLVMIGTSTELKWSIPLNEIVGDVTSKRTLPIKEIIKGAWRGRIEIDSDKDVFENGSGQNFAVTKY